MKLSCPTDVGGGVHIHYPKTEENFKRLSENIASLVEFILDKKNIHTVLKRMARSTARALKDYAKDRKMVGSAEVARPSKDGAIQTSPVFRKEGASRVPSNREKPSPPTAKEGKKPRTQMTSNRRPLHPKTTAPEQQQCMDTDWMTAERRKTKRKTGDVSKRNIPNAQPKAGLRPARPGAFKIKTSGATSYADIIRKVKGTPDLKELGERVTRIRRTRAGELLLELGKPGVATQEFQAIASSTLKESAEVTTLTHKEVLITSSNPRVCQT